MHPDFIQTQQEVARKKWQESEPCKAVSAAESIYHSRSYVKSYTGQTIPEFIDIIIAEAIANIGRKLEARCEELEEQGGYQETEDHPYRPYVFKDDALTLIRSMTGISPTR